MMLRLIYDTDETIAIWVGSMLGENFLDKVDRFGNRLYHSIGVLDENGRTVAGIVYHDYFPEFGNIELSIAAITPLWARKNIIAALLHYPFETLKCHRVTTVTPARNKSALRFNKHLGFIHEGTLRKGAGRDDIIINGLLREEAEQWLKHYVEKVT